MTDLLGFGLAFLPFIFLLFMFFCTFGRWIVRQVLSQESLHVLMPTKKQHVVVLHRNDRGRVNVIRQFSQVRTLGKYNHIATQTCVYWLGSCVWSRLADIQPITGETIMSAQHELG